MLPVQTLDWTLGFIRFNVTLWAIGNGNEHHCATVKRSGIARFAPLHVSKARDQTGEKQIGSKAVGPRRFRVDSDEEDRNQNEGRDPRGDQMLPDGESGSLFAAHIVRQ